MFNEVQNIINLKVKPILMKHNGDIELIRVKNNIVEVKLSGACSGCPTAKDTLEEIVFAKIKEEINQIQEVVLVNDISDDIIEMAKKILNSKN